MNKISVVVPVFNEENNIDPFYKQMRKVLNSLNVDYEIIFILDPSSDNTENKILNICKVNEKVKLICLSRRFGQPAATMAGISSVDGDCCVIIDVDLQDPPEVLPLLYSEYLKGNDVVLAKRKTREGETFLKKTIAHLGYKVINFFSDIDIPVDTGDFRLISKKVVSHLKNMQNSTNFLRGMVAYVGFKQETIFYDRKKRSYDKSKYNQFFGSIRIAVNGLIGFSSRPLYIMTITGFFLSISSFSIGIWYLLNKLLGENYSPGLPTNVLLITFFSGIQLLSLGLIGEYVGRIYDEVKNRPSYIIDKKYNFDNEKK